MLNNKGVSFQLVKTHLKAPLHDFFKETYLCLELGIVTNKKQAHISLSPKLNCSKIYTKIFYSSFCQVEFIKYVDRAWKIIMLNNDKLYIF